MDAPRALVFRPLVKGNEALGTRLRTSYELSSPQPRPQGFLLSCARNIGTPGQAQRHSGFEWVCKYNRLRPEPIKFVRLDSEHAQSDGKSVNRGLPELDLARGRDPRLLTKRITASGNEIVVPRAHDPSGLRQGSIEPLPCRRAEGSWALGTRMSTKSITFYLVHGYLKKNLVFHDASGMTTLSPWQPSITHPSIIMSRDDVIWLIFGIGSTFAD